MSEHLTPIQAADEELSHCVTCGGPCRSPQVEPELIAIAEVTGHVAASLKEMDGQWHGVFAPVDEAGQRVGETVAVIGPLGPRLAAGIWLHLYVKLLAEQPGWSRSAKLDVSAAGAEEE